MFLILSQMITPKALAVIDLLPDSTYWEDVIVHHFTQKEEKLSILDIIADCFSWFDIIKEGKHQKTYVCIIPDRSVIWRAMLWLFCDVYEIPFETLRDAFIFYLKFWVTIGDRNLHNIYIGRIEWLKEEKELLPVDRIICELADEMISNIPDISEKEKSQFIDQIKWHL